MPKTAQVASHSALLSTPNPDPASCSVAKPFPAARPSPTPTFSSHATHPHPRPNNDAAVKIVTGSLHGVLRIFHPRKRDYQVEDLMLEKQLDQPILQLSAGIFS